jgi:hypothetical protein
MRPHLVAHPGIEAVHPDWFGYGPTCDEMCEHQSCLAVYYLTLLRVTVDARKLLRPPYCAAARQDTGDPPPRTSNQ